MEDLFSTTLVLSFVGSAAYVLLKLLSLLGGGRLSQSWRYWGILASGALFALPVHKLWDLTPRLPVPVRTHRVMGAVRRAALPAAGAGSVRLVRLAAALWLMLAAGLAVWNLGRLFKCRRTLVKGSAGADGHLLSIAEGEARRLGVRGRVRLLVSPLAQTPVMVGFLRPTVILPIREMSDESLRLILAHELTHFLRRDLWKKLFFTALRCVHWFNPVAYLMSRDFAYRMETACDERVVSGFSRFERKSYGYLLIDCAPNLRREAAGAFVPFASCRRKLERRISTMLKTNKKGHVILGVILALALLVGCLAVSALAADAEDPAAEPVTAVVYSSDGSVVTDVDTVTCKLNGDGETMTVVDAETGETIVLHIAYTDTDDVTVVEAADGSLVYSLTSAE